MIEKKLRVLHVIVQPVLVYDDGNELYPGPAVQPVQIRLSELSSIEEEILNSLELKSYKE